MEQQLRIALAVRGILRNRKTGGCSCGGACAACQACACRAAARGGPVGRDAHCAAEARGARGGSSFPPRRKVSV